MDIKKEIVFEIVVAIRKMGGMSDIQSIVGSWFDTQSDEETLNALKQWNEGGFISNYNKK